jgi:predicted nucleic acid-binding protein
VYVRIPRHEEVAEVVDRLTREGRLGRASIFDMEALYSTRPQDYQAVFDALVSFPLVPTHQSDWDRAVDVMGRLAATGRHRVAPIPDLLVAAVAERVGLTVLHYDHDFEFIGAITGQPMEAVVPLGTVG